MQIQTDAKLLAILVGAIITTGLILSPALNDSIPADAQKKEKPDKADKVKDKSKGKKPDKVKKEKYKPVHAQLMLTEVPPEALGTEVTVSANLSGVVKTQTKIIEEEFDPVTNMTIVPDTIAFNFNFGKVAVVEGSVLRLTVSEDGELTQQLEEILSAGETKIRLQAPF